MKGEESAQANGEEGEECEASQEFVWSSVARAPRLILGKV